MLGAFDLVNTPLHPEQALNPEHYGLFAPRIGLAYRLTDKTVIRTGGGVFFIPATCSSRKGRTATRSNYYNNALNATIDSYVTLRDHSEQPVSRTA